MNHLLFAVLLLMIITCFFYLAFTQVKNELKYVTNLSNEQRRQLGALHDVLQDLPTDATTPYSERVKMLLATLEDNKLELRQIDWHLNLVALDMQKTRINKITYMIKLIKEADRAGFIPRNNV